MELATSTTESEANTTDTLILEIFKSNSLDMSGPRQLLKSIKTLQAKNLPTTVIAKALKIYFKAFGENLNNITCFLHTKTINILDFLDDTCTRETVIIILSAFQTEEEACNFIVKSNDKPSGFEQMLRNKNYECALPMIELLWKNKKTIISLHSNLCSLTCLGPTRKTLIIDDMVNNAKTTLNQNTIDETVLIAVLKKLKKYLNPDHTKPEYWLELA